MNSKFKYNPNINIRYPEIKVQHDDEIANTFFSFVISGDVNKLNQYVVDNSIPITIRKEKDGKNALHLSVESKLPTINKLNIINYLLINHIPVNERDYQGNTPLLIASKNNDSEVVDLLIKYGAEPSMTNMFGINSLHYAASGILSTCEDVKINSIIEEPSPTVFKDLDINDFSKSVNELFDKLVNELGQLGNIELKGNNDIYEKRINSFLEHIKSILNKIEDYEIFKNMFGRNKSDALSKIKTLIGDSTKNVNEVIPQLIEIKKDYINKFFSNVQEIDSNINLPLDLQSSEAIANVNDTGMFLQDHTGKKDVYLNYYRIDGNSLTINQFLNRFLNETKQSIDFHNANIIEQSQEYINIISSNSTIYDLEFQIINSGQQTQKLEIFQNIERLREYGTNANIHHDYKQIDTNPGPAVNNINISNAYKNLLTNTNEANNFGIAQLDQSNPGGGSVMERYKVKAAAGAGNFELSEFNNNPNNGKNIYNNNILNNFTYDDYKPFTDEKGNNKTIEINFREPVSILFSNSNFSGGLSNAVRDPNDYFNNNVLADQTKLIFKQPNRQNNGWIFAPSNGCHNITKMSLEYNNLTEVKITLSYLIQLNPPAGPIGNTLIERTISSDFITDARIVFLQQTSVIAALVDNTTPWSWLAPAAPPANIYANMLLNAVNRQTFTHNNPNSIKLSFATTGGNDVYGQQNIYNPLYAFHTSVKEDFMDKIIEKLDDFDVFSDFTGFGTFIQSIVDITKLNLKFYLRYIKFLEQYYDERINESNEKINIIIAKINNEYKQSNLLQDIVSGLESTKWNSKILEDKIIQNFDAQLQSTNGQIENIQKLDLANKINHNLHSKDKQFNINCVYNNTLVDLDLKIIKEEYTSQDNENALIGNNNINIKNGPAIQKIINENIASVRGIEFFTPGGNENDFTKPDYKPLEQIPSYVTLLRNRILEESLLYIFHNKDKDGIKSTYDKIKKFLVENVGLTKEEILHPIILSTIGDFIDIRLINEIKNKILEVANESFMKLFQSSIYEGKINIDTIDKYKFTITAGSLWKSDGHPKKDIKYNLYYESNLIGTMTTTNEDKSYAIEFILDDNTIDLTTLGIGGNDIDIRLALSPITFADDTIDIAVLDMDKPFELDLSTIDDNVKETIKNKIKDLNPSLIQILNKGDKLIIDPEFKYYEHISNNKDAKVQQIYYSMGFLDNSSQNMCIKYNNNLLTSILDKFPDVNVTDMYGNTPLLYAIKTNNYLAMKTLLDRDARVLFKNNDGITPIHYSLDKLKNICGYFPDDNLITSINKSYIIGLKDEITKIDSSHNVMKNYDKLVELYLFLYNSMAYTNLYANNYNLLIKFIELAKDELAKTFMEEDANKFPLLLVNPLYQFIEQNEKIQGSLKSKAYVKQNVPSVLLANKALLEGENKKLEMEIEQLEEKINKSNEYKTLVDYNYQLNINEKIIKLGAERDIKVNKLKANKKLINKINGKIDNEYKNKNSEFSKFRNMPKKTKDLINQNIIVSQLFQDDSLSYEDSKIYLGVLDKMLQSEKYGMSAYNVHSHLNIQMKKFIGEMEQYLERKYYTTDELNRYQEKCQNIKDLVKETLSNNIFSKNSLSKKISKNDKLKDIFNIICFTIDQVIGYSFYKVLFRLLMTYFSKIIPKGQTEDDKYIKYIGDKTKDILEKSQGEKISVKNLILPNYSDINNPSRFEYKPSYLTERMVSTLCGIKLSERYSEEDNNKTFNLIINLISNNNVLPIDSKSKIYMYLDDVIVPYFEKYYTISIKTLNNLTSNYENMIQNQYSLLKIIDELLKKSISDDYQLQII